MLSIKTPRPTLGSLQIFYMDKKKINSNKHKLLMIRGSSKTIVNKINS